MNIRLEVFRLLCDIEKNKKFSNIALDARLKQNDLSPEEKASLTSLLYGVIEKSVTLDYYIACAASRSSDDIDREAKNAIRIGLYEMLFGNTSEYAAVNEAVKLGSNNSKKGFVNAVLRNFIRQKSAIEEKVKKLEKAKKLSVKYSVSMDVAKILRDGYSEEKAEAILSALEMRRELTLRINTEKISVDGFLDLLHESGISAKKCKYSDFGISLESSMPPKSIPGFDEGFFFVQDEASQLCSAVAAPNTCETLIDTCSCPGSKSFSAALCMKNRGKIYSLDAKSSKLPLIEKGAQRLDIPIISVACHDGCNARSDLIGIAESVLCDVPCSGIGVISKKPEIRTKSISDIETLPEIQYRILCESSKYVKAGGKLIYSTCTLNPAENENNVLRFRDEHPNFKPLDFSFKNIKSKNGMLTLFPDEYNCDGFFISKFVLDEEK